MADLQQAAGRLRTQLRPPDRPRTAPEENGCNGTDKPNSKVMTSDLDIYRTASVLIREHGEDADLEAAMRADVMLEKGCLDGSGPGSAFWRR